MRPPSARGDKAGTCSQAAWARLQRGAKAQPGPDIPGGGGLPGIDGGNPGLSIRGTEAKSARA
jgi:hypothetical protein